MCFEFVIKQVLELTWVVFGQNGSSAEVASDIRVAILLVVVVEGVGGMRHEVVRLETWPALLDGLAVRHPEPARPVQRVLQVDLGHPRVRHTPRYAVQERRVPFWGRHCCHRNCSLFLLHSHRGFSFRC